MGFLIGVWGGIQSARLQKETEHVKNEINYRDQSIYIKLKDEMNVKCFFL